MTTATATTTKAEHVVHLTGLVRQYELAHALRVQIVEQIANGMQAAVNAGVSQERVSDILEVGDVQLA